MAAKMSSQLKFTINESTVRRLRERRAKRQADDDSEVLKLHPNKRGRKVVLGEKLDDMIQGYINRMREKGSVVNTAIVRAGALEFFYPKID